MTANVLDEATLRDARAMCRVGADALFRDVCDSHESLRSQLAEARAENDFLRGVSTASSHNEHDMGQLIQELKAERDALVAEVEQLRAVANEIAAEKQRAREDAWQLRTYNAALREKLAAAELDLEQARVQLAGCGVAAMQNTKKTIADRACPGDYGWSASYGDVCRAVDREMAFRDALAAVRKTLKEIADNPCRQARACSHAARRSPSRRRE
jgi:chromosome segregation ATPase